MKRNIFVPQEQLLHIAPEMTIVHAAVLDYIVGICTSTSSKLKRIIEGETIYTWVSLGALVQRMPLLRIKKSRISRIILDLEAFGLLESRNGIKNGDKQKKFLCLTEKTDKIYWSQPFTTMDSQDEPSTTVDSTVHYSGQQPSTTVDIDIYNKNNKPLQIDPAAPSATGSAEEEHSETEYEPAMKPKFSMDGNADLHQERKPPTRKMLTDPKYLETLALYQQRVFKNCTARTQSIYEGIPRAERIFESYFGEQGHQLLLQAIDTLPKSEVFKWMLDKTPTANAPKKVFSQTFIENHLVALVTSTKTEEYEPTNPHLVKRAATEEERRKIQEANKERVRKFMEQLKGGKA